MPVPYGILIHQRILLYWGKCAKVCMQKLLQNTGLVSTKSCWKLVQYPQSLAERRTKLKLCQLYNILHGHCYFPQDIFVHLLQIITLLDPITWLLVSPLHTPILFYTQFHISVQ